jgi:hypothetical protein
MKQPENIGRIHRSPVEFDIAKKEGEKEVEFDKYDLNLDEESVLEFYDKIIALSDAQLEEETKGEQAELPYDLFVSSVFYFKNLSEDMCKLESDVDSENSEARPHFPSDNTMVEIVLPVAFRGLLIHLMNP